MAIRKAAVRLLPLLAVGYGIAFIDRVNIGFAALQMNADLHFSATVYGLGGGLFFVSYALLEVPSNLMLVRFGARKWLGRIMFTWGILAAGMMFVRTPMQFYVMRFLLGAAEAGFFPGVVLYLGYWFPVSYRGRAITRFYFAYPLAFVLMGAVAGPLLALDGLAGLRGWQWLFLVEGLPAIAMSALLLWLLPDTPASAAWLTESERHALAHVESATDRHHTIVETLSLLANRRVLLFGAANLCVMGATYAASLSAPLILRDATAWSASSIGLLVAASNLVGAVAMLLNGWDSDLRNERYLHTIVPLGVQAIGYFFLALAHSPLVVIGAYCISIIAGIAAQAAFWLTPSDEFRGRLAQIGIAAIGSIGMVGAFIGPYAFGVVRDYTGDYQASLLIVVALFAMSTAIVAYSWRLDCTAARKPRFLEQASIL
jgi:ACS family tartrate transporter-like MFS transporter